MHHVYMYAAVEGVKHVTVAEEDVREAKEETVTEDILPVSPLPVPGTCVACRL